LPIYLHVIQNHSVSPDRPTESDITRPESVLLDYVRAHARLIDVTTQRPPGWLYATPSHLLLARGRLFRPGLRPTGVSKMPDRHCFINASRAAKRNALLYVEGMASFTFGHQLLSMPHAWCAGSDGVAIDPTWDPGAGAAYLGIAFDDTSLWPTENLGVLDDHRKSFSLLRHGLAPDAVAIGRPLPTVDELC
jgi:hypothetical protein